jgi:hypothetical protein
MGTISPGKPPASCIGCFAWGVLPGRYCRACYTFGQQHQVGGCLFCRRQVPLKKGYCRLCWLQASHDARGQVTVLEPFLHGLTHQQLFLEGMHRIRQPGPLPGRSGRRGHAKAASPSPPSVTAADTDPGQLMLEIDIRRDYSRFDRREHADLANPTLVHARQTARTIGEARGWTRWVASDVDRALVILLSNHAPGDHIRFSELFPVLRRYGLSAGRTIEILQHLNLFDDDRTPAFETWLDRKLADIAPGIGNDVAAWAHVLRDGGSRSTARSQGTVWNYLLTIQQALITWSQRYHHLREVTRDDIVAIRDSLHGSQRENTIVALRSLFRFCKKTGRIFRDPTLRVHVARKTSKPILPLAQTDIDQAIATVTTPAVRVILALAAIHAARPKTIRELRLTDIDLGNRRLIIDGTTRPLDDLTRQAVTEWLDYRRTRWPNTANPNLLVTQQTAMKLCPAGRLRATGSVRGLTATLERLRVDRQLDEALACQGDPLHLAAVFGIDDKTAIRYAAAARDLRITSAEQQDPVSSPRTQGPDPSWQHEDH